MKTRFDTLTFTTNALAAITGGTIIRPSSASHAGLVTDSRIVEPHNIFLALRGERVDGHNFIGSAAANGAGCIIAERTAEETMRTLPEGCAVILVANTLYALGALAKWYYKLSNPTVIAVTGSVGKTTTKQMIHAVAASAHTAMRTEGNYNNEIGLPLTLMQLAPEDEIAVLEAGMSYPTELHRLSLICEPDITVITNIGTSHIENLGSREGIRDAKLEMLDGMHAGGTVILNGDEPLLTEKADDIRARGLTPIYFAKENPHADYVAEDIRMTPADCTFSMRNTKTGAWIRNLHIPVTGEHNVGNAMAAYLCGILTKTPDDAIRRGLDAFENTGMRQKLYAHNGYTIIEDCYNASPESMEASLRVLASVAHDNGGRSIAVLGDMRELGSYSPSLHKRVGSFLAQCGIDHLITVGEEATEIASGAVISGMREDAITVIAACDDAAVRQAAETLSALLSEKDTVLFKASRAVALERVVRILTEKQEES